MQDQHASRGTLLGAMLLILVLAFALPALLPEAKATVSTALRSSSVSATSRAVSVAALDSAAPATLPHAGATAVDGGACVNGKNAYQISCGIEPDGQVHVYPPATDQAPCLLANGQVQLVYVDARGGAQTVSGARQWDAQRGMWAVAWPQGVAYFLSLPACPGAVH